MRHSPRTMRHSSWSLFMVPLALPLVLVCVPGARGPVGGTEGAPTVQEMTLEGVTPAPQDILSGTPRNQLRSQATPPEADSLLQARLPETMPLKG